MRRAQRSNPADAGSVTPERALMELMCGRPLPRRGAGTGLTSADVADVRREMIQLAAPLDAAHLIAALAATRSFVTREWREDEHGSPMADENVIAALLTRSAPEPLARDAPSPDIVETLDRLLELGLQGATISLYLDLDSGLDGATPDQQLAARFRGYDAMVRGAAYEPQELPLILALFDDDAVATALRETLGFDASAAVDFEQAITRILEQRFEVNDLADPHALRRTGLVKQLSVTPQLLARKAQRPFNEAQRFLEVFSVGFGHRERGGALMGGSSEIRGRPLVAVGGERFIPTSGVNLMAALRPRLEAAIKNTPLWERYQTHRAKLVEDRTETLLREALAPDETWTNVGYDVPGVGTAFEADRVLLVDDTLLVIEVKAGDFSDTARRGRGRALADDLEKLIGRAAAQASRFETAVRKQQRTVFYDRDTHARIVIPTERVRRVYPVVVTLRPVGWLQGARDLLRAARILPSDGDRTPWIVGLHELELIAHLTDYPSQLTRFIDLRLRSQAVLPGAEELNLWMLYLRQSLDGIPNGVPITVPNERQILDTYVLWRHDPHVERPQMKLTDATKKQLACLQERRLPGWLRSGEALIQREQRGRGPSFGSLRDLAAASLDN